MSVGTFTLHAVQDKHRAPADLAECEPCLRERLSDHMSYIQILGFESTGQTTQVKLDYDAQKIDAETLAGYVRCHDQHLVPPEQITIHVSDRDTHSTTKEAKPYRCVAIKIQTPRDRSIEVIQEEIEASLSNIDGLKVMYAPLSKELRLRIESTHCPIGIISGRLSALGYQLLFDQARICPAAEIDSGIDVAEPGKLINTIRSAPGFLMENWQLSLCMIGGLLLVFATTVMFMGGPLWLRLVPLAIAAVICSVETFPGAIEALKKLELDVDVLMFVAAGGAAVLGHFEEAVFLLFLFGLGAAGEELALGKAKKAINALANVAPEIARRLNPDGTEQTIPVEDVLVDDTLIVLPFERMPADGLVLQGSSVVDQAVITGESVPVDKSINDEIFAGTINGSGRLKIKATKSATETTLARVIKLVEEASASKSNTELVTEKIEKYYVPAVFVLTILFIVAPPMIMGMNQWALWQEWFMRSMAFLTAASPCALAIGAPAAILCGIARTARIGALIKGGGALEMLGRVDAICFDKTGTLTIGKPAVVDILPVSDHNEQQILQWAGSIEAQVNHPLAHAVVQAAKQQRIPIQEAEEVEQLTGQGVIGRLNNKKIRVGRVLDEALKQLCEDEQKAIDVLHQQGKTVVMVSHEDRVVGFIGIADQLRPQSKHVVNALQEMGMNKILMLTGDNASVANHIARQVGIEHVYAELMPQDKLDAIDENAKTHKVAMVGDGVNDAPALAKSHVGIAIGGAGADVAMETADVVLMGQDIFKLPEAISVSRFVRRLTLQNMIFALAVIGLVAPLALLGKAELWVAVLLHEGSTVLVVLNSLRILGRKAPKLQTEAQTLTLPVISSDPTCGDDCNCELSLSR